MRILFFYPNQDKFPFPIAPIGILTLAGIMKEKGHEVAVTDLMFSESPEADITRDIGEFKPDLVAISIRNYNNQNPLNFTNHIEKIKLFVDLIRSHTEATIVCGGAGFTRLPVEILDALDLDYGICGEAEESFPLFVEKLESGGILEDIPGILLRKNGEIIRKPWVKIEALDKYPFQSVELINYQQYLDNGGYVAVESKRGCPCSCIYCDDSIIYGKNVRTKNPVRVVDEIENIQRQFGYRDFYFADSLFTMPTRHFEDICKEIIKRELNIRFETETTPAGITRENASLLKQAGCIGVFFGIDTGSPKMLKALNKSFTTDDILKASAIFSEVNIPYAVCINFGGPGETMETVNETIDLLKNLPDCAAVFFNLGFKVEKGTSLADIALAEGKVNENIDYMSNGMYFADGFGDSFLTYINELCKENPGWMPIHPEENEEINDTFQILTKMRKKSKDKPAWLKSKKLFSLLNSLNTVNA